MTFLQLLNLGNLPTEADLLIPPESRDLVAENLAYDITYRSFRAPGRACNWRRQWFAGSIVLSNEKIIAFRGRKRIINTRFDDPRFAGLRITAENNTLLIAHAASLYRSDWSGSLEHRFHTPDAEVIADMIFERTR